MMCFRRSVRPAPVELRAQVRAEDAKLNASCKSPPDLPAHLQRGCGRYWAGRADLLWVDGVGAVSATPPQERAWESYERNYSGGRFGVWHNDNFTMLRVEAGIGDVTASIRDHEAWDLALRLSPKVAERLDYLFTEMKKAQDALHQFTWADALSPALRKIADDWDCGADCERAGSSMCHERDEGCRFVEAYELRQFADALEYSAKARGAEPAR